ncbi:hypothetical protein [Pseudoscardovia suis]
MDGAVRRGLVGGGFVVAACSGALEQHIACFGGSTTARVGFPLAHVVSSIFVSVLVSFQCWRLALNSLYSAHHAVQYPNAQITVNQLIALIINSRERQANQIQLIKNVALLCLMPLQTAMIRQSGVQ